MEHERIRDLLPDYVLGLLPAADEALVNRHLARCMSCRELAAQERQVGQWVSATVQAATNVNSTQLRALMPQPPTRGRAMMIPWTRQLVPLAAILLLLFSAFFAGAPRQEQPIPALLRLTSTATVTQTPTATLAQQTAVTATPEIRPIIIHPEESAVDHAPSQGATPRPSATPVAAIPPLQVN